MNYITSLLECDFTKISYIYTEYVAKFQGCLMRQVIYILLFLLSAAANAGPGFITTWEVSSGGDLWIHTQSNSNYTIDWGDGTVESGLTETAYHQYVTPGIYTVEITGDFYSFQASYNLRSIEQWGNIQWTSLADSMSYLNDADFELNATDVPDLSNVTSMSSMFRGTNADLNIDFSTWNFSNVSDMSYMFNNTEGDIGNINAIDTSNVINMQSMFENAYEFDMDLSGWDTSKVTNMSSMFEDARAFNSDIGMWNTSSVTNMAGMFSRATLFNQDISGWNVANVGRMDDMFNQAHAFNQAIGSWDTSSVYYMSRMFNGAIEFNQPLTDWNISNVFTLSEMFAGAKAFDQALNGWDTSNVQSMDLMFSGAENFNQPLQEWDVSNVGNMSGMFQYATKFNQPIGSWDLGSVSSLDYMFLGAESFNQPIGDWSFGFISSFRGMFEGAISFNQSLSNWDVSRVSSFNSMFKNAKTFNSGITTWDLSGARWLTSMFEGAETFNQDIGEWNVSYTVNLESMFRDAISFNQDISNWDVSFVENAISMFQNATAFDQNLEKWETYSMQNIEYMFSGATSFDNDLGNWNVRRVYNAYGMFDGVKLSLSNYDSLLKGWSVQAVDENVSFSGGNSIYCGGALSRASLINDHSWQIIDAGEDCSAPAGPGAATIANAETNDLNEPISGSCGADAENGTVKVTTVPANGFANQYDVDVSLDDDGVFEITDTLWSDGTYELFFNCTNSAGVGPTELGPFGPIIIDDLTLPPAGPGSVSIANTNTTNVNEPILGSCGADAENGTVKVTTIPANGFANLYDQDISLDGDGTFEITGTMWSYGTYELIFNCTNSAGFGPSELGPFGPITIEDNTTPAQNINSGSRSGGSSGYLFILFLSLVSGLRVSRVRH